MAEGFTILTPRRRAVYDCIVAFIAEHQYAPTFREIGRALGISHVTASEHVSSLTDGGYLRHQPGRARSLEPTGKLEARLAKTAAGHGAADDGPLATRTERKLAMKCLRRASYLPIIRRMLKGEWCHDVDWLLSRATPAMACDPSRARKEAAQQAAG
ncbi:MAG TPA: MarR family transcriptional regulator [Phycisphaerae bacterium]|nr:MarR family transcriptional regulator [Phycisphaerae bacterium]